MILAVVSMVFLAPPATDASAIRQIPFFSNHQSRGEEALAQIEYDWQTNLPEWKIEFHGTRKGFYGLAHRADKRIEIFVRPGQSDEHLLHVVAHEIGHAVDVSLNSHSDQQAWQASRNIESFAWWPRKGESDFDSGAGDFAESFAHWQVQPSEFWSELADRPTEDQLFLLRALAYDLPLTTSEEETLLVLDP